MIKSIILLVFTSLTLALAGCAQTQRPATPNEVLGDDLPRTALVIGNGDYLRITSLDNPSNDAGAIAAALKGAGYKVHRGGALTDLGRDEMQAVVEEFAADIRQRGGIAFIYYAGHGIQVDGQNYLIPVDADIKSTADIATETVDLQDLLKAVAASNVQMKVIVIDACRDNPFEAIAEAESGARGDIKLAAANTDRNLRTLSSGLSQIIAPPGALVAFATAPGSVALDGTAGSRNSPYAEALADVLNEPGLRVEDAFIAIRNRVRIGTSGAQVPWETSSLTAIASLATEIAAETAEAETVTSSSNQRWDGEYYVEKACASPKYANAHLLNVRNGGARMHQNNLVFEKSRLDFNETGEVVAIGSIRVDGETFLINHQGFVRDGVASLKDRFSGSPCELRIWRSDSPSNPVGEMRNLSQSEVSQVFARSELSAPGLFLTPNGDRILAVRSEPLGQRVYQEAATWYPISNGFCATGRVFASTDGNQCWTMRGRSGAESDQILIFSRTDGRAWRLNRRVLSDEES